MQETAAERERRLRQIGGGSEIWNDSGYLMSQWYQPYHNQYPEITNPCRDIVIDLPQIYRCTIGDNPLIKFTKFKFNF